MHAEKRPPARGERLALRVHVSLVRQLVALARVAAKTGGDDVVPGGAPAFVTRRDVVEIELGLGQDLGAILAGKFIPQEDIAAGEFHLEPRQPVVKGQHDDFRHADGDLRAVDHFIAGISDRVGNPRRKIMGIETLLALHLHDLGMADAEQMQRAADGTGVDRLPEPIQNEHGMFEYGSHDLSQSIAGKLAKPAAPATQKVAKRPARRNFPAPPHVGIHGKFRLRLLNPDVCGPILKNRTLWNVHGICIADPLSRAYRKHLISTHEWIPSQVRTSPPRHHVFPSSFSLIANL